MVGIWSVAIWSLVRVFGAATESRQLSFAGPRPSGKVRSFAPQTDMVATTRQICRSPLVLSVGHAEWRANSAHRSLFYGDGPVSCAVLTMHTAAYDGQGPS